ncbi:protein dispatched homolog 2 isoform X2 [Synchiropus splendidus]|uniref:protein dispatched homolog 2 isoform X2 n=1 Tax=Synchiropus splendidus TaxID=270530 RepID=UPI00237E006E|nr:protein dispatched homolog 2 isoform X2 [Synchiropus splendidus]
MMEGSRRLVRATSQRCLCVLLTSCAPTRQKWIYVTAAAAWADPPPRVSFTTKYDGRTVPPCGRAGPYESPQSKRCPHCGLNKTLKPSNPGFHENRDAPASVGSSSGHHGPVKCHRLHGSNEGGSNKQKQRHVVTVREGGAYWLVRSYSQALVDHPLAWLLGCGVLLLGCSVAGLLIGPLPDFSEPLLGFEPRGTDIAVRQSSLTRLMENTGPGKVLSPLPQQLSKSFGVPAGEDGSHDPSNSRIKRMLLEDPSSETFLCETPNHHLAQLVFRSENAASLWSLKSIHAMCEMETSRIRSQAHFQDLCQQHVRTDSDSPSRGVCCPSWSLGNYLAVLTNASCCLCLTSQQVSESLSLLRKCAPYYHQGLLVEACAQRPQQSSCSSVPSRCKQSQTVFQILHFLVDKDFLSPQTVEYQIPTLKYSLLFLPVEKGAHMMETYMKSLDGKSLTYKNTTITGIDFGIKQTLFKYYLARDSVYPVLTIICLLLTMALYLQSLFLVVLCMIATTGSLLMSYFLYKVVFRLTFFPLVNLSAAIILLGSCSNHVFIFADFWHLQLSQNPSTTMERRLNRALQEVGYLILASGVTSSAAFFSGYFSSIPAIRCFSIYLGIASLMSSLLMLIWLPSSVILQYSYLETSSVPFGVKRWTPCCSTKTGGFWDTSSRRRCLFKLAQKARELKRGLTDTSNLIFLKILPWGVVKFRYIWVCWFTVLAVGGTYMSCIDPGMTLSTLESRATQLFRSSHPFERYDAEYRHMFMFERQRSGEDKPVMMMLVWGIKPSDNGNHFDPTSNSSLLFDTAFNMSHLDAQVWLKDLCERVQNQSFYYTPSLENKNEMTDVCLVEELTRWVSARQCSESADPLNSCCNNISFPYTPSVFENCLSMMLAERYTEGHLAHHGGVYFKPDGGVAALVLAFRTTYMYSFNYSRTSRFYRDTLAWFNRELAGAPQGLENGWLISQLSLFDLQQSLSSETMVLAGLSVAVTLAMLLLTTWNFLLSLFGTIAVGGSVFVTIALLVLLEWKLSGLEALLISSAAGLSVDFVANYCISYSFAPHSDKIGKVAHSTKKIGCPVAIVSSAFFGAGIIMLPATVLLFRKLGIFLFLVKCVACGFATFFFQSLCCFFGPQKSCGLTTLPCLSDPNDNVSSSRSEESSSVNGAFGRARARGGSDKEGAGYFYQKHQCPQRPARGGRGAEQYELQPLAYRLSDSFDNSTCTSKLSNRPSVLSDEIEYCEGDMGANGEKADVMSEQCQTGCPPPALQTSSPYRENSQRAVSQDKLPCKNCLAQSDERWTNKSFSSSSSIEETIISHTLETTDLPSLSTEEQATDERHLSQSSCEGLSDETCLTDIEPGTSDARQRGEEEAQLQPGRLNSKRDTLRLSLNEPVYETTKSRSGQNEEVVILPNSKPDLPDVWIKRDGQRDC